MAGEGPTILTVGHSNRTLDDFVTLLRAHRVELVADVRRFPGSHRYPHFNRESLSQALPDHGSAHMHFPELGGRRKALPESPNSTWRNEMFRGYADYMETEEFRNAINALIAEAEDRRTAIMCAEALWWQCHRSMMADYLKAAGWQVLHILGTEKTEEHRYTEPARIVEGRLTYHPLEQPDLALDSRTRAGE